MIRIWITTILFLLYGCSVFAQEQQQAGLAAIFRTELAKSGVKVPEIDSKADVMASGIHIDLLEQYEIDYHGLRKKPADAFYIKAAENSVYIHASSNDGLRNGIFWYLQQLGYRYYLPGSLWQHVPQLKTAYKRVEAMVEPSYLSRRIWYAYGTDSKKADADYQFWVQANLSGGEDINAGHSYEAIVNRNKKEFLQHPEYFAQKVSRGTIPKNPKFEVSNESLVQLCIQDAFAQVEQYKKRYGRLPGSISMDPSDGGGFSESREALKIGGPSEQVFYLANRVAKALHKKYPSVKVGLYAYNFHAAPPKFEVESNIVVLIATAFNQSAYSIDQLFELWRNKGVQTGVRDYLGVLAWDWDMPGQVKGSKMGSISQIKSYFKNGAQYYSGETNIGWISRGLGHYLVSALLWNVNADIDKMRSNFFSQMFGKGAGLMQQLYDSWEGYRQAIPLDGDLLEWLSLVDQASRQDRDQKVQDRLNHVRKYLYYVYLFKKWREERTDNNLVELLNFAYRVKDDGIVSSYPLFRTLANSAVAGKKNLRFNDPEARWKANKKKVTNKEIADNIRLIQASLKPGLKTVMTNWPQNFKEANINRKQVSASIKLRGIHKIIFSIGENENASINLAVGFIKAKNFKPLTLKIYPYNQQISEMDGNVLLQKTVESRLPLKSYSLTSLKPGLYVAVIDDAMGGFELSFTGNIVYGIVADNESKIWTLYRTNLYFEALPGLEEFIVHTDGAVTVKSPTGRKINLQGKHPESTIIKIKEDETGIWKLEHQTGRLWIQGGLPVLTNNLDQLLRR